MQKYRHIFFDLDRTLWDFDFNSKLAIKELYIEFRLDQLGIEDFDFFHESYIAINNVLWEEYRTGKIDKETLRVKRFHATLLYFKIDNLPLAHTLGKEYVLRSPKQKKLFPFTEEVLKKLYQKYHLHIITNGFEEVQSLKLQSSGIFQYFVNIITSEKAGFQKPAKQIFLYSLKLSRAKRKESLMIGDNIEVDLIGARQNGIDQVFFNPNKHKHNEKFTYEIHCLSDLLNIL